MFNAFKLNNLRISGPISISYYEIRGRDFFFFGDKHLSESGKCFINLFNNNKIEITELFDKVLSNKLPDDQKIDFFLETAIYSETINNEKKINENKINENKINKDKLNEERHGPLLDLRKKFKDCFKSPENKCIFKYPSGRFHQIDTRQRVNRNNIGKLTFFTKYSIILKSLAFGDVTGKILKSDNEYGMKISKILEVKDIIMIIDPNQLIKMVKDYLRKPNLDWEYPKDKIDAFEAGEFPGINIVKQQILNTPADIKDKIMTFYKERALQIISNYKNIYKELDDFFTKFLLSKNITVNSKNINKLIFMNSLIMFNLDGLITDVYTIAKMFDKDLMEKSKEVWLYAGDGHIETIRFFMNKYLNVEKSFYSDKISERCHSLVKYSTL
tara:strand:+ start:1734 stop:2891 length:1158 start_codon:yes stop_codon:yes gene_type:complete